MNCDLVTIHTTRQDYIISHKIKCINCGRLGHVHKTCNFPTTSYGYICVTIDNNNNIKYLVVQRKDSFNYVEFIRGKYNLNHRNYINKLFTNMTEEERKRILEVDFNILWNKMWVKRNTRIDCNSREYKEAHNKFEFIKKGYYLQNNEGEKNFVDIKYFIENTKSILKEPEYGFPKGRRNINESDSDCASREFSEESGYDASKTRLLVDKPYEEIFYGMNGKRYKNVYYLTYIDYEDTKIQYKIHCTEISRTVWLDIDEFMEKTSDVINRERRELLKRIHNYLLKLSVNIIKHGK